jgi:MraZ protein
MSAVASAVQSVTYKARYRFGVDEKRRVQIPAKWRPENLDVSFTLVLWHSTHKLPCIMVLPPSTYEKLLVRLEATSFSDPQAESLRRHLGDLSDDATLDKVGRICLPERLHAAAQIEGEVVLVGMFDRFQIWRPDHYERIRQADEVVAPEAKKLI